MTPEDAVISIQERIEAAYAKAPYPAPELPELLAVSKKQDATLVREVATAPHRHFGESRLQEAQGKIPLLPNTLDWHFIGRIQKNKIRKILLLFPTLHSIDSLECAQAVNRVADEMGRFPKVFLQINLADEASKAGFSTEAVERELDTILDLERLEVQGLMALPPFDAEPEKSRPYFQELRELRNALEKKYALPLPALSMGTSHDFEIAVEEGATIVRVGSAIFGKRKT